MVSAGICLGSTSISTASVQLEGGFLEVINALWIPHGGSPNSVFEKVFSSLKCEYVAVTGRKFARRIKLPKISEPEAVEIAYRYLSNKYPAVDTIVSAGGEMFIAYKLNAKGNIVSIVSGNKCASGTGEFFMQQIKRMGLLPEEALKIAQQPPYAVAGRCSVFCKSDCTHALNKGEPKGRVVSGLCKMMASKVIELLRKCDASKVLLVGKCAENKLMVEYIREEFPDVIVADEAGCFEALGAAVWAALNKARVPEGEGRLIDELATSFSYFDPLIKYSDMVEFKEMPRGSVKAGEECIVGLDVGSTTTKAVAIRTKDNVIVASEYLRTNGDPVGAARQCYKKIAGEIRGARVVGLGVTGSGRQIAGLHAMASAVVNEIIAHATAAAYFDKDVDTIFEIGGQDAKYTYLVEGVPADYAMNEACSAGTGSFLEEAAGETLGISVYEIADIALRGAKPPNFNDQCAAFISSDIKTAIQEGVAREDIVAGLVYSVCLNYINRVKGNRPVGNKVFMQGGVCYNRAVPLAMAAITGKKIIVPPEPGLMGAFGVALVVKQKLEKGEIQKQEFDLEVLSNREVTHVKSFTCSGKPENCDRKCSVHILKIDGKNYPFGGVCTKYSNVISKSRLNQGKDLVAEFERLTFGNYSKSEKEKDGPTVGIQPSLMTNILYPLYYTFFTELGAQVILANDVEPEGLERKGAAFCYPAELSHGYMSSLLKLKPDYIFIPHVRQIPAGSEVASKVTCPIVQAEPYYLKAAFDELNNFKLLSPVLDFAAGYDNMMDEFIKIGVDMGFSVAESATAYRAAVAEQVSYLNKLKNIGKEFVEQLDNCPEATAIVIFGRLYNALSGKVNMGIPKKFSSRGYDVIPFLMLPYEEELSMDNMYWATGEMIIKAARYVEKHPSLFGVYITNFSCGPDSFITGYFRRIMGQKPSLTLEIDSHTADAGIDTRVEAFLDIIKGYKQVKRYYHVTSSMPFKPSRVEYKRGMLEVIDSKGDVYPITHPKVHLVIPCMGERSSKLGAAALRYCGIRASVLPAPSEQELKLGRADASCKECLPLILTLGSLKRYLETRPKDELTVYFMPQTSGPCRFGQYNVLMRNWVMDHQIEDVSFLSLSSANAYGGLSIPMQLRIWRSQVIAEILDDIYSAVIALSKDKQQGLDIYREVENRLLYALEHLSWKDVKSEIASCVKLLSKIDVVCDISQAKKVALLGEIYVRSDDFSRQYIVEKLAERGIVTRTAPLIEWLYYCDYLVKNSVLHDKPTWSDSLRVKLSGLIKRREEAKIKSMFKGTKLYQLVTVNVDRLIKCANGLMSDRLTGEAILTVGGTVAEIVDEADGVIALAPFGCMPGRIAEALISHKLEEQKLKSAEDKEYIGNVLEQHLNLPFLAIEVDGNPFPQLIESRIEAFCLQVEKLHATRRCFLDYGKA
ncbi:putative CoA-substrate-specific enzyme activase [Caldicoprobacter guelmensis]|uniref:acyl-CoA dehydratase activase n=1 Tax=Caldicoprobacter guelmensis TaxID=1170224 RepID=UPI00195F0370|nr:acyl-CoA dehydratase activase [Caldicoprobacter guelmensis]MBM7582541.1 putative CoA-substrate-specific enzyme activase [Caldicoprobacter guelmensis]